MQKHVEQQPHSRSAVVHVADDLEHGRHKHDGQETRPPVPWRPTVEGAADRLAHNVNEEAERLPPSPGVQKIDRLYWGHS